jgi:cleavage and polyadenylation specificity factor subunit 1
MNKNSAAFPYGARLETVNSDRSCLISGSRDGSIGILLPIDERVYHRLALLQQILSSTYFSPFGLNPKYYFFKNFKNKYICIASIFFICFRDFREYKRSNFRVIRKRGILDGKLLWKFITLDINTQLEITQAMGTTIDRIMDNLQEIELASGFF